MKINFIGYLVVFALVASCSTSVSKTQVYKSYDITFTPIEIQKKINNDLSITIEPIDARKLNSEIFLNTLLDGSYLKEEAYSYYKFFKNVDINNKEQKKLVETLSNLYEQLDDLSIEKNLSKTVSNLLKEKLYQYYALSNPHYGYDGAEDLSISSDNLGEINPYKNNNKYLSLFKIKFDNNSNNINDINLNNFQVISETELLNPFKIDYFENLHSSNDEKMKIIYRMNMPENLRLVNNHSIIKYFATPPINPLNKTLIINYLDNNVQEFKFEVNVEHINKEITFDKYTLKFPENHKYFNIIDDGNSPLLLKENEIYVDRNKSHETIKVISLSVNRYKKKLDLIIKDVVPSQFKSKKINIK